MKRICLQIDNDDTFFTAFNLKKATKLNKFEEICLFFIKSHFQIDEIEGHVLKYKIFRKKIYIIDHWLNPPNGFNCRCVTELKQS